MKISCPHCDAAYNVDLPDLEEKGEVDFKCVKCENVFTVFPDDMNPDEELLPSDDASAHIDELDAFLDDLIEKEISEDGPTATDAEDTIEELEEETWETEDFEVPSIDDEESEPVLQYDDSMELPDLEEQEFAVFDDPDTSLDDLLPEFEVDDDLTDINEQTLANVFPDTAKQEIADDDLREDLFPKDEESAPALEFSQAERLPDLEPENASSTGDTAVVEEEDLWAKAFADHEEQQTTVDEKIASLEDEEASQPSPEVLQDIEQEQASDFYAVEHEQEYEDENLDEDEFEFIPRQKKFGPFSLPEGKTGNLVLGGIFTAMLLIVGSAYFAYQTFAPDELAKIKKPAQDIPEELTPKEIPEETDSASTKEKVPPMDQQSKNGIAGELANSKILRESNGIAQIERDKDKSADILATALSPADTLVTMSAILPVAYDAQDIKILSFVLELEVTDRDTARLMREALPVYEEIMVASVERFLSRKFYNDEFYIKDKLQKQFVADFNKSLDSGRVKKTRFREFLIQ